MAADIPASGAKLRYGQTQTSGENVEKQISVIITLISIFSTSILQKVLLILLSWLCAKKYIFCNTKVWWYMVKSLASCTWSPMWWVVAWCLRTPGYCPNQCWLTYMPFYNTAQRISCDFQSHVLKNMIKKYISPDQIWTIFWHPCFTYSIFIG